MDIQVLQMRIEKRWGSSTYGYPFRSRQDPQRDAHHAVLHITKALGKLAGPLDDLDHSGSPLVEGRARAHDVAKALADIVICVARVASEWPGVAIELSDAIAARLVEKFPESIEE